MTKHKPSYSLADLAAKFDLQYRGNGELLLTGLATLKEAGPDQLSFLASANYSKYLDSCLAGAVILKPEFSESYSGNCLLADNPYLAFAHISRLFELAPVPQVGIHPSAVVHPTAIVDATAMVAAGAVIEAGAVIAPRVKIGANSVIGADASVAEGTLIHANVTIAYGVTIGPNCIIHSGAVIGADGFGFAPDNSKGFVEWIKIHQLGSVVLGEAVEIGANTSIDRGALDDTRIGRGVKIDNQCQIAHNVIIGDNTAIAACTAIAGSASIGENCTIAGCVGIVGHIDIVAGVHVTAMSIVTKSISVPGSYSSSMPMMDTALWRKNAARIRQLDKMAKRISKLEGLV